MCLVAQFQCQLKFQGVQLLICPMAYLVAITMLILAVTGTGRSPIISNSNNTSYGPDRPVELSQTSQSRALVRIEREERPNADDLIEIEWILDEVFDKEGLQLNCTNNTISRNNGRICLLILSKKVHGSWMSLFTCPKLQGEYDCVAKSLEGCVGGGEARESFFNTQKDIGDPYNCTLVEGDYNNRAVILSLALKGNNKAPPYYSSDYEAGTDSKLRVFMQIVSSIILQFYLPGQHSPSQ